MLRDPLAIPASACRLARGAVAAIRPYAAVQARPRAQHRTRSRWAGAAIVATAVTGAAASAACGSSGDDNSSDVVDTPTEEGTGDVGQDDTIGPGLCPADFSEADADEGLPEIGPGLCPVGPDADADADDDSGIGPGLCPVPGIC
jgi:hypothetical protein